MMYYMYHIPGKKIGVTTNLEERVERQQGYNKDEYEVIIYTDDIDYVSQLEIQLQIAYGYRVDKTLYKDLYKNNKLKLNKMKINVTEMTTTFPCPVNKLKGRLMDEIGMQWETEHGDCVITRKSIDWIMDNIKSSQFTNNRCYVYNKAFSRWFDNNDAYTSHNTLADAHVQDMYGGKTLTGGLLNDNNTCGKPEFEKRNCDDCDCDSYEYTQFDLIRQWAEERGLYEKGDTKTQTLKLIEEAGEICRAVLKENQDDVIDGIGDCVVVLTNLAELVGVSIEDCIAEAYNEISNRTGKMVNGTFKKD